MREPKRRIADEAVHAGENAVATQPIEPIRVHVLT